MDCWALVSGQNQGTSLLVSRGIVGVGSITEVLEQGPERRPSGLGSHQAPASVPAMYTGKGSSARLYLFKSPSGPKTIIGSSIRAWQREAGLDLKKDRAVI